MQVEEIMAYLEAAKAFQTPGELMALAKRMLGDQGSVRQILRHATDEPTQQYLLLQFALIEGKNSGAPASRLDQITDSLAELEFESSASIHAGLNSIDAASQFASTAGEIREFQTTYRDLVIGSPNLAEMLKTILERFGDKDFAEGLKALLKALGNDVVAARPSVDPVRLRLLIEDIYRVEIFNTLIEDATALGKGLIKHHWCADFPVLLYLKELVSLTGERWINPTRFATLPGKFSIANPEASILLVTQSLRALRGMPVKIYENVDSRQEILNAGQDALDELIRADEDENDDDEGQDEVLGNLKKDPFDEVPTKIFQRPYTKHPTRESEE